MGVINYLLIINYAYVFYSTCIQNDIIYILRYIEFFCTYFQTKIELLSENTQNYIYNTFQNIYKYIPDHTLCITRLNIKTHSVYYMPPSLYLFNYYYMQPSFYLFNYYNKTTRNLHDVYYSITVWSRVKQKYISLLIDAVIISELGYIYPDNPYTVNNIVKLLKSKNNVNYVILSNDTHDTNYTHDTHAHTYDTHMSYTQLNNRHFKSYLSETYLSETSKLEPYFNSFAIPNNITLYALVCFHAYLYGGFWRLKENLKDIQNNQNISVVLCHNNNYLKRFTKCDDIIFSSLDVTTVD